MGTVVDFVYGLVEAKAFPVLTAPAVVSIIGLIENVDTETFIVAGGFAVGGQTLAAMRARFVPGDESN